MVKRCVERVRPRFTVGTCVRVRHRVMDPDYPELPLGGWAGVVEEVQEQPPHTYLVRWSRETLRRTQRLYADRCQRDDLCLEYMWLTAADLEPDPRGARAIGQPARVPDRMPAVHGQQRLARASAAAVAGV